mgnify:CR=1 FL=1
MAQGIKGTFKTYNCIQCGATNKWRPSYSNKYCDNKCQMAHKRSELLKEFLAGNYTNNYGKFPDVAKEYIFEQQGNKCGICGITDWNDKPITFQADHIDGNSDNLMPDNLRVICPNCHSQTDTWGAKSRGPKVEKKRDYRNEYRRKHYKLANESD